MTHLTSAGFTTVALLGRSISDVQEILDFVECLKLDTAELSAPPFSPARSALTRLLTRLMEQSHWNGSSGEGLNGPPPPQLAPSKPKLTQAKAGELRRKFESNYPSELICDQTMPSLAFLAAVKDMKASGSYRWIPWKSCVPGQVQAHFNESRPWHHALIVSCFGLS